MNRIALCFEIEEQEDAEVTRENERPAVMFSMADIALMEARAAKFVINNGGQWDEKTSRIHCCEVFYRNPHYIQESIKKWACTMREAYELARDAWLVEKTAGRAL